MTESFVPLVPATTGPREAAFASMQAKGLAPGGGQSVPTALPAVNAGPGACSKPVVTLQRNGEIVSGIRIQCACGQVVDLSCVY